MSWMRLTRRQLLAATAAAGASSLLAGWPQRARAAGNVLKARADADIDVLDPGYMVGGVEIELQRAVMPALVEYTRDGDELSWRPTAYTKSIVQRDATHIDFELNEGFKWTGDFGELTAEDVKYSFERMKGTDWSGNFDSMEKVEVTGTHSGTIVMNQPFTPFIMITLAAGPATILSMKATEAKTGGDKYTTDIPATCGPYLYKWNPKQSIVFTRNPDWIGPEPAFDEVRFIVIEEGKAAELAYEAGEVDVTEITPSTLARYRQSPPPNTNIEVAGALQYMWLGMNTEHPKLADIRVRKAIQHAVDVDSVIQGAYSGTTEKSYGIICPGLIGQRFESSYSYDPAKAKALLSEAGVSGLELDLKTLNWQERVLAAQIIQANLQAVGVKVNVLPLDSGPFWEMGSEAAGDQWKDLQIWLMRFGTNPDPYEATQWFVGGQVGVWNWERWKDPEYDKLYAQGIAETDEAKRNEIYLRMQQIMEDTGAYVWINHEPETFAHRTDLAIDVSPSGEMNVRNFSPVA